MRALLAELLCCKEALSAAICKTRLALNKFERGLNRIEEEDPLI